MPEPAAWRYQKIIRPLFDMPVVRRVFVNARVLTMVGDQVIESGFVEIENGKIKAVGAMSDLGSTDAQQIDCTGMTIMPGMINSHAHLAWDGVHDLALRRSFLIVLAFVIIFLYYSKE